MANSMDEQEQVHRDYAMQLASSSVFPMVLKSAIDLGLLEILGRAGLNTLLSSEEIASRLPTHSPESPTIIDRILRLLAAHSVVTCSLTTDRKRLYGLTPVSKYFIPNEDGVSLAPLFGVIQDKIMLNMWYYMKDAVLEGGLPFNRAYGMNASQYIAQDGEYLQLFRASMSEYNSLFMKKILATYKGFDGIKTLVDVGGGDGSILKMIVSMYPEIKGINFDLAHIIEKSPTYSGIETVAGNMFVSIPKGDAIFMKWMLHNWDDEHCLKILRNCYDALPNHGKAIIVDLVAPDIPETSVADKSKLQFDLFMLNMNSDGKERTDSEFTTLAQAAGFCSAGVACSAYNFSLVEFHKQI